MLYLSFFTLIALLGVRLLHRRHLFTFSVRNYYIFTSLLSIGVVVSAVSTKSWFPILTCIIFGIAGVIGEIIAALWWKHYFEKGLWLYTVETVDHKNTSLLNFLPYGIGGHLYMEIVYYTFPGPTALVHSHLPEWLFGSFIIGILLQLVLHQLFFKAKTFHGITRNALLLFFFPMVLAVGGLMIAYGPIMLIFALVFAIVGTGAEYVFGKATELIISKKLWAYTYLSTDNGHFTPLVIPFFMLGGFYFWSIAIITYRVLQLL